MTVPLADPRAAKGRAGAGSSATASGGTVGGLGAAADAIHLTRSCGGGGNKPWLGWVDHRERVGGWVGQTVRVANDAMHEETRPWLPPSFEATRRHRVGARGRWGLGGGAEHGAWIKTW